MKGENSSNMFEFGRRFLVNHVSPKLRAFIVIAPMLIGFMSFPEMADADEYAPNVVCELPDLDFTSFDGVGYDERTYFDIANRVSERFVRHESQDCWLHFTDRTYDDGRTGGYIDWSNGPWTFLDVGGQRVTIKYGFDGEPVARVIERKSPFCSTVDTEGDVRCTDEVVSWTHSVLTTVLLEPPEPHPTTYCVIIIDEYSCGALAWRY